MRPINERIAMNINWKIVAGVFAAIAVYDEVVLHATQKTLKRQTMRVNYLANKLDEANIPMNDFDEIVLKTIKKM